MIEVGEGAHGQRSLVASHGGTRNRLRRSGGLLQARGSSQRGRQLVYILDFGGALVLCNRRHDEPEIPPVDLRGVAADCAGQRSHRLAVPEEMAGLPGACDEKPTSEICAVAESFQGRDFAFTPAETLLLAKAVALASFSRLLRVLAGGSVEFQGLPAVRATSQNGPRRSPLK